ncbi:uncharacterized protein LOC111690157 isoform X1 [Lucilia cuprina]|uniref:uncharacterized protein LOC111690157 isoform X1 n=2 Tax=Lucilia cuprina TaxID=7375 RepID=UPI001F06C5D5|nr:uncharacterized protein LOC111690157 isoform X1 [Lucilia cuprina]
MGKLQGFTHTSVIEMAFQRSYSKVWWGSDDNQLPGMNVVNSANQHLLNTNPNTVSLTSGGLYSYFSQQQNQQQQHRSHHQQTQQQYQQFGGIAYHSLDLNQFKSYGGNLSRIQEVEDEQNISKLSWEKHDSPGSLRSQDSGFSDNDEFHSTRSLSGRSSKTSSPSSKSMRSSKSDIGSPTSVRTVETPPTVIRRTGNSEFYTPLVNVSRRISFSFSTTPNKNTPKLEDDDGSSLMAKLDSMQLMAESPLAKKLDFDDSKTTHSSDAVSPIKGNNPRIKKRRKVQRKATSPLSSANKRIQKLSNDMDEEDSDLDTSMAVPEYNNETVYLGGAPTCSTPPPPYNNETVVLGGPMESSYNSTLKMEEQGISPLRLNARFSGNTSTPKISKINKPACTLPPLFACQEYDNTLLNGHAEDVQTWLDDLRMSYDHEVMSTLQTKSIAQEAFKNLKITTNTVAKFIRQLQQKALSMQGSFEKVERMLGGTQNVSLHDALTGSLQLLDHVSEFTLILERRSVFFADSRLERKRYEDYLDQIRMVNKDTRYSLENHHYINLESLLEDLQVLKRIILISVQQVYEKLVRILVISVENGSCDLMLKANINMIATLMNIDYDGFASLTNAFVQTEAVRTLLVVCLDHKLSSVRAQALRALATICCAPEPIAQLGSCGGIEIIRDILQVSGVQKPKNDIKRGDMERREAVSLLTQITAAWHGPEHKVIGLKGCIETIVEGLTQLLIFTECPQTLLLCTAALNNLSRMEITSHYSIMSHETIFKLITTMEQRDKGINVFLYEQIVAMLYNMSLNKKCHSHLVNAGIINFITYAYETEFFKSYNSRGESEAQKRCIKTILHTLTRLVQDSVLGMELLEQQKHMPSSLFFKLNSTLATKQQLSSLDANSNRDISFLTHQLLHQAKNDRDEQLQNKLHPEQAEKGKKFKMQLQRQESYV